MLIDRHIPPAKIHSKIFLKKQGCECWKR